MRRGACDHATMPADGGRCGATPSQSAHACHRLLRPPHPASLPSAPYHLPQALASNTGLQSLLLDTNALGDEGAAMLATVSVHCHSTLFSAVCHACTPRLCRARVPAAACRAMLRPVHPCSRSHPAATQALAGGSRITTLNLSSNNIGDAGAKALAEMLKVWRFPCWLLLLLAAPAAAAACCPLFQSGVSPA